MCSICITMSEHFVIFLHSRKIKSNANTNSFRVNRVAFWAPVAEILHKKKLELTTPVLHMLILWSGKLQLNSHYLNNYPIIFPGEFSLSLKTR